MQWRININISNKKKDLSIKEETECTNSDRIEWRKRDVANHNQSNPLRIHSRP